MIKALVCKNFRSLEDVTVLLAPLTAIVGPNGSGKTSILRALNLVLGVVWPSLRSVRIPQDFTSFDANRNLTIEIRLDPPLVHEDKLSKKHNIDILRFVCAPYKKSGKWGQVGDLHADLKPLAKDGEVPVVAVSKPKAGQKPGFEPLAVSTGLREQARILFIDHRRSLAQHLPAARGSVLGQLFELARREFEADEETKKSFQERYSAAMDAIRAPRVQEIERTISETAKRMIGFLGSAAMRDIDIGFGFADPANPFNSLRLMFTEGDLEIPGDELGLGIQSAMVVGIFEALRQLGGNVATVVVEEPEMYLHPQAQRYFFRILAELADSGKCQVIYSTHSPIFADISRFESVRLVRKEPPNMTIVSYVSDADDISFLEKQKKSQKIGIGFDATRSELLFARRALLVEGPGDRMAAHLVAQRLGKDPDAEDLAVVSCGAKSAILFFARVCKTLGISFVVLHDEDIYPEEGEDGELKKVKEENERAVRENAAVADAVAEPSRVFIVRPSLEAALGIGRRAKDKPRRVVEALETCPEADIPGALREAVESLFEDTTGATNVEGPSGERDQASG